jgi:hypothetical protein
MNLLNFVANFPDEAAKSKSYQKIMKNKIKVLLFLFLIGSVANSAFAQKNSWTIGVNFGLFGTICQKAYTVDSYRNTFPPMDESPPFSFELTAAYGITNYLSISTGIAWAYKDAAYKRVKLNLVKQTFGNVLYDEPVNDIGGFWSYASFEIPLKLNFAIPLGKSRFYFLGNTGVVFDVMLGDYIEYWVQNDEWYLAELYGFDNDKYWLSTEKNLNSNPIKINFLINAGIGFGYRFKCGVGLSLTGDYNAGTRIIGDVAIKNLLGTHGVGMPYREYMDKLYYKGDYWKVALGISYTFKQKKRE